MPSASRGRIEFDVAVVRPRRWRDRATCRQRELIVLLAVVGGEPGAIAPDARAAVGEVLLMAWCLVLGV